MDTTLLVLVFIAIIVLIGAAVYFSTRQRSSGSAPTIAPPPQPTSRPTTSTADETAQPAVPPPTTASPGARPATTPPQPRPITPPRPIAPPQPIAPLPEPAEEEEPTRGIRDVLKESERKSTSDDVTQSRDAVRNEGGEETEALPRPSAREPVEFTSYYPKEVAPNAWYSMLAYVYRTSAAPQVITDATNELGERLADYRRVARPESIFVMENAQINVTPRIKGFQFNPVSATVGFYDTWNRADFKVRANGAAAGEVHEGTITFTVEGIIVCEIPLFIEVNANASPVSVGGTTIASQPTTQAPPRKIYQAVFCSYSRKDTHIVERVERAYRILGFDYLRDLTTIRPGEDWDQRLLQMIDQADIFQLFWSTHSATSAAVRKEWTRALELAKTRPSFIRPVFWEEPMPPPPAELGHINFAFEPTLDD